MRNKNICIFLMVLIIAVFAGGCASGDKPDDDEYSPTSSLSIDETETASLKGKMRVAAYYATARGDRIASEYHLVDFAIKDKKADHLITKILGLLISGPANKNLQQTLPPETKVNSVKIAGSVANIDFDEGLAAALESKSAADLIIMSIVNTVTELKDIDAVTITIGGKAPTVSFEYNFTSLKRNAALVTDIASAAIEEDYESVYAEVDLE